MRVAILCLLDAVTPCGLQAHELLSRYGVTKVDARTNRMTAQWMRDVGLFIDAVEIIVLRQPVASPAPAR